VARLADACNIVDCDIVEVRHKLAVLRRHLRAAITTRSKRPAFSPGYLPAMTLRWRQSASGWLPADHCAASPVR
jgi:hypothetical protein